MTLGFPVGMKIARAAAGLPDDVPEQGGGFSAFLANPALREALMGTGAALLQQADSPGTFGGALGRALPAGMQAFERAQRAQEFSALLEGMDPTQRRLFELLGPDAGAGVLAQGMLSGPSRTVVGENQRLVDDATGEVVVDAVKEAPEIELRQFGNQVVGFQNGEAVTQFEFDPEANFGDATALRKEFDSAVADVDDAVDAFTQLQAVGSQANPTAQDDIALVFAFMKSVDPTSSVREGEFATASNAGGIDARLRNMVNNVISGERLTPEQRANLVQTARTALESRRGLVESQVEFFGGIADRNGIERSDVLRDPFSTLAPVANDPLGIR